MEREGKGKGIDRRRFLKLAGGAVGVTALACCGVSVWATRSPEIELIESSCGGEEMEGKILVAYASKCGSTAEIAQVVGQALCDAGAAVDVRPIKEVAGLQPYRAAVVGSAIRVGQWLPEAKQFVETHQEELHGMPAGYFFSCMTLYEDTEENRQTVAAYLEPIRAMVEPVAEGRFAGAMDYSKLSMVTRLMMKAMSVPEGDYRDWDAIRAWGTELYTSLTGA
jgi:menaquinone-dependent protoporphyrinogen oxidase